MAQPLMNSAHWRMDEFALLMRPFRPNDGRVPDADERVNGCANLFATLCEVMCDRPVVVLTLKD